MARTLYLVEIDNGQEYEDNRVWVFGVFNTLAQAEKAAVAEVKRLNSKEHRAYDENYTATINPIVVGQVYHNSYKTETIIDKDLNIIHPLESK